MGIIKYDINEEEILRDYLQGISCFDIAKQYGCSETNIRNHLSKLPNYKELKKLHRQKGRSLILPICSYPGCDRKAHSKKSKYCFKHESVHKNIELQNEVRDLKIQNTYIRKNTVFTRYWDTDFFSIKLGKNECITLVDNVFYDKCINHCWNLHYEGYVETRIDKKVTLLHNFIFDRIPDGITEVDHISRNRLDNRQNNLRIATSSQNKMNTGLYSNNTSGITGVSWDKNRNKWHVMITVNKKNINLGRYDTFDEAVQVRLEAEKKYFGEFVPIERGGSYNDKIDRDEKVG